MPILKILLSNNMVVAKNSKTISTIIELIIIIFG